jgi:deoxycytidylate deaminase
MLNRTLIRKINKLALASLDLIQSRHRHFSFITQRNRIISYGYNKIFRSHPISCRFNHRFNDIHSELAAILDFPYHYRTLNMYQFINLRIRRDTNKFGLAKPCKCCRNMLTFFGVRGIYFTNEYGDWVYDNI